MKEIPGIPVIVQIQFHVPKIAVWMEFLPKIGPELMELLNKVIKVCRFRHVISRNFCVDTPKFFAFIFLKMSH